MPAALRIRVPATTANLGAGYDLMGLALELYNEFEFVPAEALALELAGPRAGECTFRLNQESLIWRAFARLYQECGQTPPYFALRQQVGVPLARGLGSSSTVIVAALMAANTWLHEPLDKNALLALATELEGHPDNVAPALWGGCVLNFPGLAESEMAPWIHLPVPASLHWGVCIPAFELSTVAARAVLPARVAHRDAVLNSAYLSALVSAFYSDNVQLLRYALQDCLHQAYRRTLVPGMAEVMAAALEAGALGCVLSGAGPTLLAVWTESQDQQGSEREAVIGPAMLETWRQFEIQAEFVTCLIDRCGAICLD